MIELDKTTQLQWRRFLASEAGVKGALYLRWLTPSIPKGQPHDVQYDAGFNQGYVKCIDRMEEIAGIESQKDIDIENK